MVGILTSPLISQMCVLQLVLVPRVITHFDFLPVWFVISPHMFQHIFPPPFLSSPLKSGSLSITIASPRILPEKRNNQKQDTHTATPLPVLVPQQRGQISELSLVRETLILPLPSQSVHGFSLLVVFWFELHLFIVSFSFR